MQTPQGYKPQAVLDLLGIPDSTLRQLRAHNLLPHTAVGRLVTYDREYVDGLAAKLRPHPHKSARCLAFFELYHMYWHYHAIPAGSSRGQRDKYHRIAKDMCEELVSQGTVTTLETLAKLLAIEDKILRGWANKQRLLTLPLGMTHYLTVRYARYVIHVLTELETVYVAADRMKVSPKLIWTRIRSGSLEATKCPDGLWRVDPAAVEASINQPSDDTMVTASQAAILLGVSFSQLRSAVSLGVVKSVGFKESRRISLAEIERWQQRFSNLNPSFAWLQPLIMGPGKTPLTLSAKQTFGVLGISAATLTVWSQQGLLPFFIRSFSDKDVNIRLFVRLYVFGLKEFAHGKAVTRPIAISYAEACKEKNWII